MASRQSKGQGDRYFSESVSPTESEQKPLARARGFANLNEAFQNITVKKESTNDTSPEDASGNGPSRDRYNRKLTNASSGGQSDEATIRRSQDVGFSQPTTPAAGRLLTPRGAFPNEPLSTVAEMPRRDGAITRRGVRDEEPEIPKHTLHRAPVGYRPVGSPPSDGLPESPEVNMIRRHRRSMSLQDLSSPLASSSVSDSQRLLDPDVLALSLRRARRPTFPSSQKLPRQQNQTQYSSDEFIGVPSLDDSDVNYSNYHSMHSNPHDQVRLQPSREKNVSRALRHVSNAGEASQATFVTSDGSPIALKGPASPIPSDVAYANLQKLHPVRDIKVNIGGGTHHDNGWEKANETRDQLGPRDSTGDGDWVTELTSDVDQSSIYDQSGFPQQAVYQPEHNEAKPSGGFVSRFRVLQHPGKKVEPESYELRTLKDTKQQVFLPRTQAGGMGAYPENSTRNPFPRHSSRKLSNPFSRIDSYRRLDDNGSFNVKINREFPDHLRFRDSTASEYSAVKLGRKRASTLQPMSFYRVSEDAEPEGFCEEVSSSKEVQVSPQKPRLVDQDYPNRRSLGWWRSGKKRASRLPQLPSFNGEPITAQSKFPFELIPLDEAQRKNKLERESGETDETEPAAIRYQRAMSASSSQALPSSRRVRTPQPIHARGSHIAPHLSIDFSPSSVFYRDALHDISVPYSANSHRTIGAGRSHSAPYLGQGQSHTPIIYIPGPSDAPERSWFKKVMSRLFYPKSQNQNNDTSNATVVHNPPANNDNNDSIMSFGALEAAAEPHLSEKARVRRHRYFIVMAALSILPFIAIPVITGKFDEYLSWYTEGEVRRITKKQRAFIRNMFLFEICVLVIVAACITAVHTKNALSM